jgi:hypothetical protein
MLKKKKVKKDPPQVIAARERMRPVDRTKIVVEPPEINDAFDFCWVHHGENMMGLYSTLGYKPVSKKKYPGITAPAAYGNKTDDFIHHADTILCMRDKEIGRQEDRDRIFAQQYETKMRYQGNEELAAELGMKNFSETLTVGEPTDEADEDAA